MTYGDEDFKTCLPPQQWTQYGYFYVLATKTPL
jgi:hypothetical protein